jgi:hypothetical protein
MYISVLNSVQYNKFKTLLFKRVVDFIKLTSKYTGSGREIINPETGVCD